MKTASDQPGRPTSRQANEPRTQLRGALAILCGGAAFRAVQAPLGVACLVAGGAEVRASRAPNDRADPPVPAQLHLEQLGIAQPGDLPEEKHAGQGHERVAEHEQRDRDGDVAARQDELRPDAAGEQKDGRPSGQPARVAQAHVEPIDSGTAGQPLERREGRAEWAQRWPRVAGDDGDDRQADPDEDPEQHCRQRRDVADHESDRDRAVPPRESQHPEHRPRGAGEAGRHGPRPVRGSRACRACGACRDHEGGGHRRAGAGKVEPERDRKLERAADGMRRGRPRRRKDDEPCRQGCEADPRAHGR